MKDLKGLTFCFNNNQRNGIKYFVYLINDFYQLIETVLPAWIAVVKLDKKSDFIALELSNTYFRQEFDINSDFNFRKFLRQVA